MALDERAFFSEKPETRQARHQCPRCKRTSEYGALRCSVGEPGKGAAVLSERLLATGDAAPKPPPPPPVPTKVPPIPFGGVDPLYVMGSDGLLRTLRVSDGVMTASLERCVF